jgi:hypothetical protein
MKAQGEAHGAEGKALSAYPLISVYGFSILGSLGNFIVCALLLKNS